jgi:hypothetical protein
VRKSCYNGLVKGSRAVLAGLACAVAAFALPGRAQAAQCGLPDAKPLWIEFSDGSVGFRAQVFRRPGLVLASNGVSDEQWLRAGGAQTIYWVMKLERLAGTNVAPADPATVPNAADVIYEQAVAATGCATPWIALNELRGPTQPTPWSQPVAQYRNDVLLLLSRLAQRGARPFLLSPSNPNTAGDAAAWWHTVASVSDVVREVYFPAPSIVAQGPLLGSRALRVKLRTAVRSLTGIGVPASRVGLMLGFQSGGIYGRVGLQPLASWLEFVKLNALAARQVAQELGPATIWSWGWGTFNTAGADPDKPAAACVYLWTRDPSLCDGPALGGADFDTSLTEGQILLRPGVQCSVAGGSILTATLTATTRLAGSRDAAFTALLERAVQRGAYPVPGSAILAAERGVVSRRFAGNRRNYLRYLSARRVTLAQARGVLADELRRKTLGAATPAWSVAQENTALQTATCLGDELPTAGDVRLAARFAPLQLASA